jgi:hypothetical protein
LTVLLTTGAAFAQGAAGVNAPAAPRALSIADAMPDSHGVKRMVVLRGLDKLTGRAIDVNAPVGVPVRFGSLIITARICHTVPPEEPPETSAFLQIDDSQRGEAPKRVFSGWMFASTPALNALEHAVYDVWVVTCKTEETAPVTSAAAAPPGAAPAKPAEAPAAAAKATAPATNAPAPPKP